MKPPDASGPYTATRLATPGRRADTAAGLAVLLLCRVDGKSKLEYLSEIDRIAIRELARELISAGERDLAALFDEVSRRTEKAAAENGLRP